MVTGRERGITDFLEILGLSLVETDSFGIMIDGHFKISHLHEYVADICVAGSLVRFISFPSKVLYRLFHISVESIHIHILLRDHRQIKISQAVVGMFGDLILEIFFSIGIYIICECLDSFLEGRRFTIKHKAILFLLRETLKEREECR